MWFITAVAVVGWICVILWLASKAIDDNKIIYGVFAIFVTIAPILYPADSEENKGPCAQYETQMHYNAATKATMPARVCVNRGEWINE